MKKKFFVILSILFWLTGTVCGQESISLNGKWEMGEGRHYSQTVEVPGIHCDPTKMNNDTLWYRREVILPKGTWTYATLQLKGARFAPAVFVDGQQVSRADGGMAPTFHLLNNQTVKPGKAITLEVALTSLKDLPKIDASYIAVSDHWRSNVSSSLWDDVVLHLHGVDHVVNVIPESDTRHKQLTLSFFVDNVMNQTGKGQYTLDISDRQGNRLIKLTGNYQNGKNTVKTSYKGILEEWSPEAPNLYNIGITLRHGKKISDRITRKLGIKQFEVRGKQFYLNGRPCKLRGGSITWHRWMRSPEGPTLGYDVMWFRENVLGRMKDLGANEVNFHLGLAPTRLLDLCDEMGMLVCYEWSFFHGMPATEQSCREQYGRWMASSMEHPCAAYYYPYNETSGKELETAWNALNDVLKDYPTVVVAHRDIMHLHKYWWSIFENLGVYYDNYLQFDQAVMADEFGGNYLDKNGDYGGYPSVKESFLRFCGRNNTKTQRLRQQILSTGKIAEYWRRTGVAGWTPYTIISSYEDGNSWFQGDMQEGNPMPVWDSMAASWSPQSVSMDIWDVNYTPGQHIRVPLYYFNDLGQDATLKARVSITDSLGNSFLQIDTENLTPAYSHQTDTLTIALPNATGYYTLQAELINRPRDIKYPVTSKWNFRIYNATVSNKVLNARIYVPNNEYELKTMLSAKGLTNMSTLDKADIILLSSVSWQQLASGDQKINQMIERAIKKGTSVVMLDVGPQSYGKGYPVEGESLKSLLNPPSVSDPKLYDYPLFGSIIFHFKEAAEAETNIFPDSKDSSLWTYLPDGYRGMWNGLRGDLVLPAWEMEVQGVNADLFLEQWTARGANESIIKSGQPYYAYELHGYYDFSTRANDEETRERLKASVMQKIEDSPSLAVFINPNIPIKQTDISAGYRNANTGMAKHMIRMVNAGKNLTKVPVIKIEFGEGKGNLIVSQLLTAGRLSHLGETGEPYERRYDETAVQMVLNMIEQTLNIQ